MIEFQERCQVCSIELTHHGTIYLSFYSNDPSINLEDGILYLPAEKGREHLPYYVVKLFEYEDDEEFIIIHHDYLIRISETN